MDLREFIYANLSLLTILQLSVGVNFLSPNQTLADGDVLISPAQKFEVGFFSPGKSTARFLGIWYKATPDIVIWVANRNNPIMDSTGVLLLSQNGTLVVSTAQRENIWSSGSSAPASSPVLRLLDTGNLVVSDISSNTWQSFDYPTDTRLPGMKMVQNLDNGVSRYLTSWKSADDPSIGEFSYKIENQGLSQVVIMKAMDKIFRGIFWNGYFPEFPVLPDGVWISFFPHQIEYTRHRMMCTYVSLQAWLLWNKERELELMDPCYNNTQVESQVRRCIQVALLCVQNKAEERPPMSSVLFMLSTDSTALPQPQKPGFFLQTSNEALRGNALRRKKSSRVSISISDELAR